MELNPVAPVASKSFAFPASSSGDRGLMEVASSSSSSSSWNTGQSKRKRLQIIPSDVLDIKGGDDPVEAVIDSTSDQKDKQPLGSAMDWQKQVEDVLAGELMSSSEYDVLEDCSLLDIPKGSKPDPVSFDYLYECEDDAFDYDEDYNVDFGYEIDMVENDYNYSLAAKFDNLDLPTGVEATVPWLEKHTEKPKENKLEKTVDEIDLKFNSFKQFDTVQDHSDHYFSRKDTDAGTSAGKKPPKDWVKRIQNEWKVLEKDLPESIFVRTYEDKMDLIRAVIIGPAGTPYHDGLFFFDICFPANYPHSPPLVHYHSGGLRINPNLYACGKVCLSLLNTWPGTGCEKWSSSSTMLQVLVSIQALVLNANPYFNEPGYEQHANTPFGENVSTAYNEDTFLHSCRTMLYSLRRPPKHFEDFIAGHFRQRGHAILQACKAYIVGAKVGNPVVEEEKDFSEVDKFLFGDAEKFDTPPFKLSLKRLFEDLLMELTVKGADCDVFLAQKVKAGAAKRAQGSSLKL